MSLAVGGCSCHARYLSGSVCSSREYTCVPPLGEGVIFLHSRGTSACPPGRQRQHPHPGPAEGWKPASFRQGQLPGTLWLPSSRPARSPPCRAWSRTCGPRPLPRPGSSRRVWRGSLSDDSCCREFPNDSEYFYSWACTQFPTEEASKLLIRLEHKGPFRPMASLPIGAAAASHTRWPPSSFADTDTRGRGGTGPRPGQCKESAVSGVGAAGEHPMWGSHTAGTGHPGSYSGLLLEQDCVCTSDHQRLGQSAQARVRDAGALGLSRTSVACLPLPFAPCSSVCGSGICAFRRVTAL